MLFRAVPTPCVGICSTTYGDTVCRGCRRYLHEVIDWNRYSDSEKRLIWQRLDGLQAQVLPSYFRIIDPACLSDGLRALRIPFREDAGPWTWLQTLLKHTARQDPELGRFGVERLDTSDRTLAELRDLINEELHTLASAYHERDLLRARLHP
ncbi:MAG: DUF1289 domain-containing protein [Perlucidibaca sp.]